MKAKVSAPRKRAGEPHKDVRDSVYLISLTASDEVDEEMLASLYRALFIDEEYQEKLAKLLKKETAKWLKKK